MPLLQSLAQPSSARWTFLQDLAVGYREGKMLSHLYTILVLVFYVWLCCIVLYWLCCYSVALAILKLAV